MTYEEAIKFIVQNWDDLKLVKHDLYWDNPSILFIAKTDNEEDYEGSQTQIGIAQNGSVRWEYQSHCSCNSYEDSAGLQTELNLESTLKSFELREIPEDWKNSVIKFAETKEIQTF